MRICIHRLARFIKTSSSLIGGQVLHEHQICIQWKTQVEEVLRDLLPIIVVQKLEHTLENFGALLLELSAFRLLLISESIQEPVRVDLSGLVGLLLLVAMIFMKLWKLTIIDIIWVVFFRSIKCFQLIGIEGILLTLIEHEKKLAFGLLHVHPDLLRAMVDEPISI